MKKIFTTSLIIILLLVSILSCSTKKNRFLNRAFHATTSKYNVLYNGKEAYKIQKKQLDDSYKDNFWKTLPIEPLKIEEELSLPKGPFNKENGNTTSTGGFTKAEEKAVKAVQKHSMNIGGEEKNKQIDDAYMLLGKSRYYDQRFVPALETFKYIQEHYPNSKLYNKARIWEAKSLIRIGIEDDAIFKLDLLLKKENLSDATKHEALTAMALAYTKQDSVQNVINLLDSTLLYKTKNHNQKARNLFILGQLYRQQEKIDSSNAVFEQLSNFKKAPYRFKIHSKLERAKNYNSKTDNTKDIVNSLKKLARNRDNRPFLDAIYYQLGKVAYINSNTNEALNYYKKAIQTKQAHNIQKSLAYEDIGNILFDQAKFTTAGSYYDSVLNIAKNKNTKRIRRLIRKRKSLNEVIRLEDIATKNDSVLEVAAMSKTEQESFFKTYIEKLKKADEEAKIIAQNKKGSTGIAGGNSKQTESNGTFYFYNAQTIGFGQAEFQKIWGNRELVDNWRLSNKKASNNVDLTGQDLTEVTTIDENNKYDITYYLSTIPTKKESITKLKNSRNDAYYKLGLIYKEQFQKHPLATNRLEKLLSFSPETKLILPSYYHLYKSFENFDLEKSNFYKNKITTEYPNTKYAQLINNPNDTTLDAQANKPEESYKTAYNLYLEKNHTLSLKACEEGIKQFSTTPILPKFELLKAYNIAKTTNKATFIKALQFVATTYPSTEEAIHALKVIASLKGETPIEKQTSKEEKVNKLPKKQKNRVVKPRAKSPKGLPSNEEMMERIKKNKKK